MDIIERLEELSAFFQRLADYSGASINIGDKTYMAMNEVDCYRLFEVKERAYICMDTYDNKNELALALMKLICDMEEWYA